MYISNQLANSGTLHDALGLQSYIYVPQALSRQRNVENSDSQTAKPEKHPAVNM